MSRDDVSRAVEHFGIPDDKEEYLFILPGLFVGASDANLEAKEILGVAWGAAVAVEILAEELTDMRAIGEFLGERTIAMVERCDLDDLDILMKGVQSKLTELPADKAGMVTGAILATSAVVANASGHRKWVFWGHRVNQNESETLKKIISYL